MTPTVRASVTLAIFAATLVCAIVRPRRIHEAIWTCLGAALLLALGLARPHDVVAVLVDAKAALLFLLALLLLSALLERSGFFEWAAVRAAQLARGDAHALYRNVFFLGAAITALLSLDTTAVILTPLVLSFVKRLGLPARPYVFACAFVANTASLPLPISNLTNLLFAGAFHLGFAGFLARMLLPQAVALALTYALFRRLFAAELPDRFAAAKLPPAATVVPHRRYFHAACVALAAVCAGYFVGPLVHVEPYWFAFAAAALLAGYGLVVGRVDRALVGHISWALFPFVVGLFVVVRAVENLGLARWLQTALDGLPARHPELALAAATGGTAVASNLVNNLPAALLARGVLLAMRAPPPAVYGALLGSNLGPNLLVFGSLATILVCNRARAEGHPVGTLEFAAVGARVTPLVLTAAAATLALSFLVVR